MKYTPLGLLALLLLTLASCSKKPDAPIPLDAAVVLHINGARISEKLPWSEVKQSDFFKQVSEAADGDSLGTALLNDPVQSGLDIRSDGWLFFANRGKGTYAAFVWNVADAEKFEGVIKRSAPEVKIQEKESTKYIAEGTSLLAWTNKKIFLLSDASELTREFNGMTNPAPEYDSLGNPIETEQPFELNTDGLLEIALELQALKSDKQLGSDDKFADLINTKGDVHFWFNAGKLYGNTLAGSLISLSKLSTLIEGNIATATINFNEGAIDIDSKNYVGKELEALYKKYEMSDFDAAALKNIPPGEVNMALAMNYPPQGLKALLTLFGVDGLVNTFLREAGFSIDEFIKANNGNLFFALSDFQIKKIKKTFEGFDGNPVTYDDSEPDGKLLFGAAVNDKGAFQKMMDVIKKLLNTKVGVSEENLKGIPYELKDNWFIAGNDSAQIKNYGTKKTDHAFLHKIEGHPFGVYVNIQSFIKGSLSETAEDAKTKEMAEVSLKFWKDLVMTGGEFKKGASVSKITLTMGDANTNSLKSLNQYLGQLAKIAKEQNELRKKEWESVDSTPIRID